VVDRSLLLVLPLCSRSFRVTILCLCFFLLFKAFYFGRRSPPRSLGAVGRPPLLFLLFARPWQALSGVSPFFFLIISFRLPPPYFFSYLSVPHGDQTLNPRDFFFPFHLRTGAVLLSSAYARLSVCPFSSTSELTRSPPETPTFHPPPSLERRIRHLPFLPHLRGK